MTDVSRLEVMALLAMSEHERTEKRVEAGELPGDAGELPILNVITLLAEELGEVAEIAKRLEGMKPFRTSETKEHALNALRSELIQTAAISLAAASTL